MKKSLIVILILILSAFVVPAVSLAAGLTGPIVPSPAFSNTVLTNGGTNGANYTICDLRTLANNIINFAVAFSVIVATLMIAYGGVLYVTGSAGGEAQIKKAHKVLLNAVVGIMIVLLAWILVNIVVSVLSGNGINFWVNSFQCSATPINPSSTNAATNTISGSLTPTFPAASTAAGGKGLANVDAITTYTPYKCSASHSEQTSGTAAQRMEGCELDALGHPIITVQDYKNCQANPGGTTGTGVSCSQVNSVTVAVPQGSGISHSQRFTWPELAGKFGLPSNTVFSAGDSYGTLNGQLAGYTSRGTYSVDVATCGSWNTGCSLPGYGGNESFTTRPVPVN